MKTLLVAVLTIALCAPLAMADPVKEDAGSSNFQLEMRGMLVGELDADHIFQRFSGGSPYSETRYSADCALEMNLGSAETYSYAAWIINVTDSEPVGLEVTNFPVSDSILAIFCGEFDVMDPTANMIGYNDDSINGGLLSYIDPAGGVVLNPGEVYTVVVCTYSSSGGIGPVEIVTTENVVEGSVADAASSWDSVKSLYR